jgi:hypothetical protein
MNEDREHVGVGIFRHQGEIIGQPHHEQLVFIGERRQRIECDPIDQYRGGVARHDAKKRLIRNGRNAIVPALRSSRISSIVTR